MLIGKKSSSLAKPRNQPDFFGVKFARSQDSKRRLSYQQNLLLSIPILPEQFPAVTYQVHSIVLSDVNVLLLVSVSNAEKRNRESLFLTFEYKSVAIWYWAERKRKTSILLTFFMPSFHINTIPNVTWLWNFTARVFCLTFFCRNLKADSAFRSRVINICDDKRCYQTWLKKVNDFIRQWQHLICQENSRKTKQRTALFDGGIFLLACVITRTRWIWMKNLFIVCLFNIESISNHFLLCCENNSLGSMRGSLGWRWANGKLFRRSIIGIIYDVWALFRIFAGT